MKFDKNTFKQVRIPTAGMKPFKVIYPQFSEVLNKAKMTQGYADGGQLIHHEDNNLERVYFVQREDGYCVVIGAGSGDNAYHLLEEHLDENIKAEVILCKVPAAAVSTYEKGYLNSEFGALEFIAQHHPDSHVRVDIIARLENEAAYENKNSEQLH
ncbi:hypothetical protein [Aliiglaciecola sp. LCG003]|uniref:hypothetical protein n=1 Tax=Aliiglaciecola sp. LCG003 TaxID=3053655 RepID=UPI002573B968|nr:hypothetical protein [Aliiglaciecola sp. LCG003]WJG10365.1 hypothetical protein QR722_04825 [Aliiglaciecola sp. LCG003]